MRADDRGSVQESIDRIYRDPGHCSYVYAGARLICPTSSDTVIGYEVLGHHPPKEGHNVDGSNVLFGDGTLQFIPAKEF